MKKNNFVGYFSKRFPIGGVIFISLTVALTTGGLYAQAPSISALVTTILIAVSFAAFLLRQRVVDEFKDKNHDSVNYPDRPFQKGTIDAKSLIILGLLAFGIELTTVYAVGGTASLLWYLPVLFYSLLMMKEFFCGLWLEKHFTLYFILHEVVFLLYAMWLAALFGSSLSWQMVAWIVFFASLLISVEVGRKFTVRKDPKGKVVKDTYCAVWGRDNTIITLGLLLMTAGIALTYAEDSLIFAFISAVAVLGINVVGKKQDSYIKAILILHTLTLVTVGVFL